MPTLDQTAAQAAYQAVAGFLAAHGQRLPSWLELSPAEVEQLQSYADSGHWPGLDRRAQHVWRAACLSAMGAAV